MTVAHVEGSHASVNASAVQEACQAYEGAGVQLGWSANLDQCITAAAWSILMNIVVAMVMMVVLLECSVSC